MCYVQFVNVCDLQNVLHIFVMMHVQFANSGLNLTLALTPTQPKPNLAVHFANCADLQIACKTCTMLFALLDGYMQSLLRC